jgi:hypothetical protein
LPENGFRACSRIIDCIVPTSIPTTNLPQPDPYPKPTDPWAARERTPPLEPLVDTTLGHNPFCRRPCSSRPGRVGIVILVEGRHRASGRRFAFDNVLRRLTPLAPTRRALQADALRYGAFHPVLCTLRNHMPLLAQLGMCRQGRSWSEAAAPWRRSHLKRSGADSFGVLDNPRTSVNPVQINAPQSDTCTNSAAVSATRYLCPHDRQSQKSNCGFLKRRVNVPGRGRRHVSVFRTRPKRRYASGKANRQQPIRAQEEGDLGWGPALRRAR